MIKRLCVTVISLALVTALFCGCSTVRVDNAAASADLVRHNYNQEDFFTIQAIFNVQRSFHPVSASYLCDYEGLKLECKREIPDGYDYYVLLHDTIRCFIFVDDEDDVQQVLVAYRFPTLADVQSRCNSADSNQAFPTYDDDRVSVTIGRDPSGTKTVLYFCSDGVLTATYQDDAEPLYQAYTDDALAQAYPPLSSYQILPIDKQ